MKYTGSTYKLGRELGISRGQSINVAATPSELAAVERATLAMIEAVRAAVVGNDAADSYEIGLYVDGVRDGQNYAMGRASKLEQGLRRGLESIDKAARA